MAIKIKPGNRGKLHRALGVPKGERIPAGKLAEALRSESEQVRKEAQFAKNAESWRK